MRPLKYAYVATATAMAGEINVAGLKLYQLQVVRRFNHLGCLVYFYSSAQLYKSMHLLKKGIASSVLRRKVFCPVRA